MFLINLKINHNNNNKLALFILIIVLAINYKNEVIVYDLKLINLPTKL